jgi:hypothetical protein
MCHSFPHGTAEWRTLLKIYLACRRGKRAYRNVSHRAKLCPLDEKKLWKRTTAHHENTPEEA